MVLFRFFSRIGWTSWSVGVAASIAIQIVFEGTRWQMVPVYLFSTLLFMTGVSVIRRAGGVLQNGGSRRRFLRWGGILSLALGYVISVLLPVWFPVFSLPAPVGEYAIGTVTFYCTDSARLEVFSENPKHRRELVGLVPDRQRADRCA